MAISESDDSSETWLEIAATAGSVFLNFGRLECSLSFELRRHLESHLRSQDDDLKGFRLASAIYGGMRFKDSSAMVKRIAEQEHYPSDALAYLTDFFGHIGHIAALRDKLAHQVVMPAIGGPNGTLHIIDAFNIRNPMGYKRYEITTKEMAYAAVDLKTASKVLQAHPLTLKGGRKQLDLTPVPWRYKSSMLKLVRRKTATSPTEHQLQPQS